MRLSGSFYLTNVNAVNLEECNKKFGKDFQALYFFDIMDLYPFLKNDQHSSFLNSTIENTLALLRNRQPAACSPTAATASRSPG